VLFINAADHFEKGKRQNRLLPEHITKIIDSYQHRTEQARYARRVKMSEIESNGYNLNISRYISTAKDEVQVDLVAVNAELVRLTQEGLTAKDKHNVFLRELGLPLLP
jgi:type I restriction enzyme M protein